MKKVYGEGNPSPEKKVQRTGKTVTQTTTTVTTRVKGGTVEKYLNLEYINLKNPQISKNCNKQT